MEQLIPIFEKNEEVLVNGRDLHDFLQVNTPYAQWFDRMVGYGFEENVDYIGLTQKSEKPFGGRPTVEHHMKLDMAKEVAMIQRTEKGKEARQYFINIEKSYKKNQVDISNLSPELQMFNRMFTSLAKQEIELQQHKVTQERIESKVEGLKEILSMDTKDWRKEATNIIRKIALKQGGFDKTSEFANESYDRLENKARCNLNIRLENRRKNMIAQGMGKTAVKKLNKLSVIEEDHRLKEIYVSVVKVMALKYGLWEETK